MNESRDQDRQTTAGITRAAARRSLALQTSYDAGRIDLEPRFLVQMAHLTTPATVWKYIEKAVTGSKANLVMLDLEDSIPRGNLELLATGRSNCIRAFNELDWGSRLRFFRPRGLELDPAHEDIVTVVEGAGARIDGLVYPKTESAEEIESIDLTLTELERQCGLNAGSIRIEALIESTEAVERVFEIARSSRRLVGLVFGSYDYWASAGLRMSAYRADHPILVYGRIRLAQAAASVGIPAIAEMTTNYPTRDKREADRLAAIEEFRRDAMLARDLGFAGKWTGIPDQTALAAEIFQVSDIEISQAIEEARMFLETEQGGRGATMVAGKMVDRATDRVHRGVLKIAYALGRIDPEQARELGII